MALSPAEKQKRYRERQRDVARADEDVTLPYCSAGFAKFAGTVPFSFDETLDALGVRIGGTPLDEQEQRFHSDGRGEVSMTSLERATRLAGAFIDAAQELTTTINQFKRQQLRAGREVTMASAVGIVDEDELRAKFAEADRLGDMLRALMKHQRHDFLATEVKGI